MGGVIEMKCNRKNSGISHLFSRFVSLVVVIIFLNLWYMILTIFKVILRIYLKIIININEIVAIKVQTMGIKFYHVLTKVK